jgi:hypothetical protein
MGAQKTSLWYRTGRSPGGIRAWIDELERVYEPPSLSWADPEPWVSEAERLEGAPAFRGLTPRWPDRSRTLEEVRLFWGRAMAAGPEGGAADGDPGGDPARTSPGAAAGPATPRWMMHAVADGDRVRWVRYSDTRLEEGDLELEVMADRPVEVFLRQGEDVKRLGLWDGWAEGVAARGRERLWLTTYRRGGKPVAWRLDLPPRAGEGDG